MAFTGDGQALTGAQGTIYTASLGTEESGDGATALDAGLYLITAVDGTTTGWPANSGADGAADISAGYILRVRDADTITPESGDSYKAITLTERCDVTSWNLPFTADEIEVTSFCDTVKTYAKGKADASGSISGVVKVGTTTGPEGFLRQFIDVVQQDGSTSIDFYDKTSEILLAYLVANKDTSLADEVGLFLPINIFGAGIGGDQASAQSFDGSFRIANYPEVKPALYRFAA
jgi:hypothetical protein